jgi:hypothetical protein
MRKPNRRHYFSTQSLLCSVHLIHWFSSFAIPWQICCTPKCGLLGLRPTILWCTLVITVDSQDKDLFKKQHRFSIQLLSHLFFSVPVYEVDGGQVFPIFNADDRVGMTPADNSCPQYVNSIDGCSTYNQRSQTLEPIFSKSDRSASTTWKLRSRVNKYNNRQKHISQNKVTLQVLLGISEILTH